MRARLGTAAHFCEVVVILNPGPSTLNPTQHGNAGHPQRALNTSPPRNRFTFLLTLNPQPAAAAATTATTATTAAVSASAAAGDPKH